MTIDLINIADDLEALALRSVLEYWGCTVYLHHISTAKHLVRILSGEILLSNCIVLMCHGAEAGLLLPELAPEIDDPQPYHNAISSAQLKEFLRLPDALILNTGCVMGKPEFAQAFLEAGCHSYIGPTDYPDGSSSLFFATHFFYAWHVRKSRIEDAHRQAASHDVETGMFHLYQTSS